jgi:hypothetical protein
LLSKSLVELKRDSKDWPFLFSRIKLPFGLWRTQISQNTLLQFHSFWNIGIQMKDMDHTCIFWLRTLIKNVNKSLWNLGLMLDPTN